jgi:hypothetical protein
MTSYKPEIGYVSSTGIFVFLSLSHPKKITTTVKKVEIKLDFAIFLIE